MYRIDDIEIDMTIVERVIGNNKKRRIYTASARGSNMPHKQKELKSIGSINTNTQQASFEPVNRQSCTPNARDEAISSGKYIQIGDIEIF